MTKKGSGKSKGTTFERRVCVLLSKWWTQNDTEVREDIFWRSDTSGGRATTRQKKGKTTKGQYGDICASDPIGVPFLQLFTIELKKGYNADTIHSLLDVSKKSKHQYAEWIQKAIKCQRDSGSKYWMLVHQRDRREPMVFMDRMAAMELLNTSIPFGIDMNGMIGAQVKISRSFSICICGMPFVSFLNSVIPDRVKEIVNDNNRPGPQNTTVDGANVSR